MNSHDVAPHDLAGMLAPADANSFLASDWSENFRHVPGARAKFAALLPWPALNAILEQHRLEPPRLRLTREGKPVPAESFLRYQPNPRRGAQSIPRLNATALTRELRDGATLVLDAVDELYPPITRLAESLERVFRVRVQVNAYAGWRTCHGFDLHWDDHDVFILQVAGRKHWKVHNATRRYPLARDIESAAEPPSQVFWEGLLEDGEALYIPRGWWHVALPLNEPTLHLTVGINNATGADCLTWFVERLRAVEIVRRDVPHLASAEDRLAFADALRAAVIDHWHGGLLDEFLADQDVKARPRPRLSLPWSAAADLFVPDGRRVRWAGARALGLHTGKGEVTLDANGRHWRFALAAGPLLEILLSGREASLDELWVGLERTGLDREMVRLFLKELIEEGLVVACEQA